MSDNHDGRRGCCCCSFILTSGLTVLFLWLSLRTTNPTCSIQDFYLPALQNATNYTNATPTNTSIYFDLKLDNKNKDKGIYYDALNLTIYYGSDRVQSVANFTIPGFYQGHKKKAHRREVVETYTLPWATVVPANDTAVFRVDLATKVRFKIIFFHTKRERIVVGAPVEVNATGHKVNRKGIKLKSGAGDLGCYRARVVLLAVVSGLILVVI